MIGCLLILAGAVWLPPRAAAGAPSSVLHRPSGAATRAVLLLPDWNWEGDSCWAALPESLRAAGYAVLRARWPAVHSPEPSVFMTAAAPPRGANDLLLRSIHAALDTLGASVTRVAVIAAGWGGRHAGALAASDARIVAVAWLAPLRVQDDELWETPPEPVSLLLAAAEADALSSAVAMELFTRFNARSELRLFSGDDRETCAFALRPPVQAGIREWLERVCALPAGAHAAPAR